MTKAKMIETLQKMEAAAFRELHEVRAQFGSDNAAARSALTHWAAIHEVMTATGVEADSKLPDNRIAFGIVREASRQTV